MAPRSFLTSAPRGARFPFYLDGRTQLFTSFFIEEEGEMPFWGARGCPGTLGCSPAF